MSNWVTFTECHYALDVENKQNSGSKTNQRTGAASDEKSLTLLEVSIRFCVGRPQPDDMKLYVQ